LQQARKQLQHHLTAPSTNNYLYNTASGMQYVYDKPHSVPINLTTQQFVECGVAVNFRDKGNSAQTTLLVHVILALHFSVSVLQRMFSIQSGLSSNKSFFLNNKEITSSSFLLYTNSMISKYCSVHEDHEICSGFN
jgi:hypothetical protein